MRKILFVATVVRTHIMQFHIPYLEYLKKNGWETAVAARNDYDDPKECMIPFCNTYYDIPFERSPIKAKNVQAIKQLKTIIDENHFDMIHCHTPVGAMAARLAGRHARHNGTKVIYTAHGFHFFKGAPVLNWMIYYPVERYLSHYTDAIITMNQEDYLNAKSFYAPRVYLVPGVGIDLQQFTHKNEVLTSEKAKNTTHILSVGELIPRKNYPLVFYALKILKDKGMLTELTYQICGSGRELENLKQLAEKLSIQDHIEFLGYQTNVARFYQNADIFIHASGQEGLPRAVMEAMACGLPCICNDARGTRDLIHHEKNGLLISNNPQELADAIIYCLEHPEVRKAFAEQALSDIKPYDVKNVVSQVYQIYLDLL